MEIKMNKRGYYKFWMKMTESKLKINIQIKDCMEFNMICNLIILFKNENI